MKLQKGLGLALVGLLAFLPSAGAFAATGRVVLRFSSPNFGKSVVYEQKEEMITPKVVMAQQESDNVPAFPNYATEIVENAAIIPKNEAESEEQIKPLTKRAKGDSYSPILSFQALDLEKEEATPQIFIDSDLTWNEAIKNVPENMPREILDDLRILSVQYLGFDGSLRQGQIIVHKEVIDDVNGFFDLAMVLQFPIYSVIPISQFGWDDNASMFANNTHGFDWRNATTYDWIDQYHGHGHAIDINPRTNPYYKKDIMLPANGVYNPNAGGTLYAGHPLVNYFDEKGWKWGGYWHSPVDLHHFQKDLPEEVSE